MLITDTKIEVTWEMMSKANMTRLVGGDFHFGVPNGSSLHWKSFLEMEDEDFDKIEEYFLSKQIK